MQEAYKVEVRSPAELPDAVISTFLDLVKKGGEVDAARLPALVTSASGLGFARDGDSVVGVGGIKRPRHGYQTGVFQKAGVADPGRFPFELGWFYVEEAHRGRGLSTRLVTALCTSAGRAGVYATSHMDRQSMHRALFNAGFKRAGEAFAGRRAPKDLWLFLRQPS